MTVMRLIYKMLLLLYPSEYRFAFGSQMPEVFEESRMSRSRGLVDSLRFDLSESASLIAGAAREWFAKGVYGIYHSTSYIEHRCLADRRFMWPQSVDRRWTLQSCDEPNIAVDETGMCVNAQQMFLFASSPRRLFISICRLFLPIHPR
jgi:hypothetical protein